MKLWPDPVHQPVNSFSMKSEETSETPNDKQNYNFLFRSNNLSKDVNFEWNWKNLKIIKSKNKVGFKSLKSKFKSIYFSG